MIAIIIQHNGVVLWKAESKKIDIETAQKVGVAMWKTTRAGELTVIDAVEKCGIIWRYHPEKRGNKWVMNPFGGV